MLPKYHILFGLLFVTFLYFFFPQISLIGLLIIFLSSILIDVDHYIYYIFQKKDLNLFKAYNWYENKMIKVLTLPWKKRKNFYSGFFFFHGIEILIMLFLLGNYISYFFIFICIGFSFHLILDIFHEIYLKNTVDKISLIWNYFRFRKTK